MAKISLTTLANLENENTAVSVINANSAAITTAFDNTLSRDGTSPNQMGTNIDMNSNRIINLPSPITVTEPLRLSDLKSFVGGSLTINSIPVGGTTNQVLTKTSSTDYAVTWSTVVSSSVALSGITGLGTGIATALAINTGSVGAPVLLNGALGSPSSVGTMPAHTLGGTIAGGGNQINDVIIGNSSPHSGAFTNLFVSGTGSFGTNSTFPSGSIFGISGNAGTTIPVMNGFVPQAVIVGADNTRGELAIQSYATAGGESTLLLFGARGTMVAPTHSVSGDFTGEMFSHPFDGTNFVHSGGAGFIFPTTEDTSPTNAGHRIDVYATPITTAIAQKLATLDHAGNYLANASGTTPTGGSLRAGTLNTFGVAVNGAEMGMQRVVARGINFNSGNTDTQIAIPLPSGYTRYQLYGAFIGNASHSLTTATFGLFSAAAGGGTAIIASGTACTVSATTAETASNVQSPALTALGATALDFANFFFRVQTAEGAAATGDVTILYLPLS